MYLILFPTNIALMVADYTIMVATAWMFLEPVGFSVFQGVSCASHLRSLCLHRQISSFLSLLYGNCRGLVCIGVLGKSQVGLCSLLIMGLEMHTLWQGSCWGSGLLAGPTPASSHLLPAGVPFPFPPMLPMYLAIYTAQHCWGKACRQCRIASAFGAHVLPRAIEERAYKQLLA